MAGSVYHAADENHVECLAVIERVVKPAKLAKECTTCLAVQMNWGYSRGAAWLLAHGADPNAPHKDSGNTALHAAVLKSANDKVIDLLLAHNADPQAKNRDGKTAIDLARAGRKDRIVKRLNCRS